MCREQQKQFAKILGYNSPQLLSQISNSIVNIVKKGYSN